MVAVSGVGGGVVGALSPLALTCWSVSLHAPDDGHAGQCGLEMPRKLLQQTGLRLAAIATVVGAVRADDDAADMAARVMHQAEHLRMHRVERVLCADVTGGDGRLHAHEPVGVVRRGPQQRVGVRQMRMPVPQLSWYRETMMPTPQMIGPKKMCR